MKLEWMGEYRDIIEKIILYGNAYVTISRKPRPIMDDISLTNIEIQVLEYLLENEERKENMNAIAKRLGISPSSFTMIVAKLTKLGLIQKFHRGNNKKDIIVVVTEYGRKVYTVYAKDAAQWMNILEEQWLRKIPKEHLESFGQMLTYLSTLQSSNSLNTPPEENLTPIE